MLEFVIAMIVIGAPWTWIAAAVVARTPVTRARFWIEFVIVGVLVLLPVPLIGNGPSGNAIGGVMALVGLVYVGAVVLFAILWAIVRALRRPAKVHTDA